MAAWLSVLKLVPWGDVIEAAPQVLQAAKKLLKSSSKGAPDEAALAGAQGSAAQPVEVQLQQLHERAARIERGQRDCVALIESLAQQNASLVQTVDALRKHNRRLGWALAVLALLCAGALLAWRLA